MQPTRGQEIPVTSKFERELLRGSLDLMVLSVLAGGKRYGYSIQKEVRQASSGRVDLAAGTLYPLLHRLEDEKLIRSTWEASTGRDRKWYELTAAGRKRLAAQAQEWTDYAACIQQVLGMAQVGTT
jgi:PadR family transcriptional regulator PadR